MTVTTTKTDNLAHIAYANEKLDVNDPTSLRNQVASTDGRIVIISFAGCSLVLTYSVSSSGIDISLILETPFGSKTIGHAELNPQHPTVKIGGSIAGFKAEATISFDFTSKVLKIEGEVCASASHCKKGSVSVHL